MSRPVTGRDAVSPLPDRRVVTDEGASFGLSQQCQGFVELPLLDSIPQGATEVVSVALPADLPPRALVGISCNDAKPLHQPIQNACWLQVERCCLSKDLINDRHPQLGVVVADWVLAALGVGDVEISSQA